MKKLILCFALFLLAFGLKAQLIESRYAIETTFDDKAPTVYEENYGVVRLNTSSGDLVFTTDMAKLKTGNKKVDSLLMEQETIPLVFKGNLGQGLFGIINQENDDTYHKVVGTITVNGNSYAAAVNVKIDNMADKSNMSKALLDLKFELDPAVVTMPCLTAYFNHVLFFQLNDGYVNQN